MVKWNFSLLIFVYVACCLHRTTSKLYWLEHFWRRSRTSPRSRAECEGLPAVDCFTKGFQTNKKRCVAVGCKWCPKPYGSKEPWCVTGQKRPEQCSIKPVVDCFEEGSEVTKTMCDLKNCNWCPKNRGPWCVKGQQTSILKLTNSEKPSGCRSGETFRYKDKTSCCSMARPFSCGTLLPEERILGGYLSKKGSWPWLIHFVPYGDAVCSAVLINERFAITAGHCVYGASMSQMKLTLGVINMKKAHQEFRKFATPKRTSIHPDFHYSPRLVKDIAIIEFEDPMVFGNSINSICLPNQENPPVGTKCFIAGWGATVFRGFASKRLREAEVFVLESELCQHAYGPTYDPSRMICAGHLDGSADSCLGDSGGPLMCQRCSSCQWYVAGLVSYGKSCGQAGYPGVYTRVSAYEEWFKSEGMIKRVKTSRTCR